MRLITLVAVVFAVYFKLGWDEAILPENIKLRNKIWEQELREHEVLKAQWDTENKRYQEDMIKWEAERKAEEKRRKENERRRLGIYWDQPFGHQCVEYGTRPYNARLMNVPPGFDGLEACGEMPIVFHGRTIEKPLRCERLWVSHEVVTNLDSELTCG